MTGYCLRQGAFAEHAAQFRQLGADVREVRLPEEFEGLDGVVLPGGAVAVVKHNLALQIDIEPAVQLVVEGRQLFPPIRQATNAPPTTVHTIITDINVLRAVCRIADMM